jgi:hypothetical protein
MVLRDFCVDRLCGRALRAHISIPPQPPAGAADTRSEHPMLYIKDYQSLENQIPREKDTARKKDSAGFQQLLRSLTGRQITVYTDNGTHPFTGLLIETAADSILLITCPPGAPSVARNCQKRCQAARPGTECRIVTAHIAAVLFPYL